MIAGLERHNEERGERGYQGMKRTATAASTEGLRQYYNGRQGSGQCADGVIHVAAPTWRWSDELSSIIW